MSRYFAEPVVKVRLLVALYCGGATVVDAFGEKPESFYGYYMDR